MAVNDAKETEPPEGHQSDMTSCFKVQQEQRASVACGSRGLSNSYALRLKALPRDLPWVS